MTNLIIKLVLEKNPRVTTTLGDLKNLYLYMTSNGSF